MRISAARHRTHLTGSPPKVALSLFILDPYRCRRTESACTTDKRRPSPPRTLAAPFTLGHDIRSIEESSCAHSSAVLIASTSPSMVDIPGSQRTSIPAASIAAVVEGPIDAAGAERESSGPTAST